MHQQKILQGLASEASKPQRAAVFMLQDQLSKEWYGAIRCSKYVAACGQETAVRLGIEMATEAFCTTLLKNMCYMYTASLLHAAERMAQMECFCIDCNLNTALVPLIYVC